MNSMPIWNIKGKVSQIGETQDAEKCFTPKKKRNAQIAHDINVLIALK